MTPIEIDLAEAYRRFGRGDLAGADALLAPLLLYHPRDPRVAMMAGQVALQDGRMEAAARLLRPALDAAPGNEVIRAKLCLALIGCDAFTEARRLAAFADTPNLRRIIAFADQREGRIQSAIGGFRRVLAAVPSDHESWHNLGLLLTDAGDVAGAVEAMRRALALAPGEAAYVVALSRALAKGAHHAERRTLLRQAAGHHPEDHRLLLELGRTELATDGFAEAEAAFARALERMPLLGEAWLELAMLHEKLNRLDELDRLVTAARARGVTGLEIDLAEGWAVRRRGRYDDALALAEPLVGVPARGIAPIRLQQLIGEAADGAGRPGRAFAAFTEMNRLSAGEPAARAARARDFPAEVRATIARLTPERVAAWSPVAVVRDPAAPVFVIGFPRSGTTLIDALLSNAEELRVLEEAPMLEAAERLLPDADAVERLNAEETQVLRDTYGAALARHDPRGDPELRIVDKFPLHMVRAALIHRLFPHAKLVLVERHPCDVVLSCFMALFQSNKAMVQFQDLGDAARLYDLAWQAWSRAEALLPLDVHRVRYERLIAAPEAELRQVTDFIGVPWRPELLDNRAGAARRGHIATASYRQVVQPLYTRSIGRWERYRAELAPVLPILAPWAERLGYPL